MIIDSANLSALRDAINTRFNIGLQMGTPWYTRLAMTVPSQTETNTYGWLADIPGFREWVGERVAHNLETRGAQIINKTWEDTIRIPRSKLEDDQYGMYATYAQMMGQHARKLPEKLLAALVKAGKTTTCYDGQYFFDTDHPVHLSGLITGVQANLYTAKPLTAANFGVVKAAMRGLKGESGEIMGINPNLLIVGPDLEKTALEILNAAFLPAGALTSTSNAAQTNVWQGAGTVLVVPELDETGVWYLMDDTLPVKPFVWQERQAVEFQSYFDPHDQRAFRFDEFEFGGRMRGNVGYGLWFLIARVEAT